MSSLRNVIKEMAPEGEDIVPAEVFNKQLTVYAVRFLDPRRLGSQQRSLRRRQEVLGRVC